MASIRYVAMWGDLQISPHPRHDKRDAQRDADKWNRQHPGKPATIVEVEHDKA